MSFTADQLVAKVLALAPEAGGYWVAFSGGLDSQVLLHALTARRACLPAPLTALHVNHNLQPEAPAWAEHCREACAALGVELRVLSVQARAPAGESPEAAARAARYRALAAAVPPGGVLLTAHHQDDQAETLLLQLLRGAGPKGLAAMPAAKCPADRPRFPRHGNRGLSPLILRPLLDVSRDALQAYAREHALTWIEDPSNARTDYDRNFLRQEILPRLRARWPSAGATLARAASHQAEAAQLLEELAELDGGQRTVSSQTSVLGDRPRFAQHEKRGLSPLESPLSVSALLRLSRPRRANLLRHWLHEHGAPMPSAAVLERIDCDLLAAAPDAQPLVCWGAVRLRRYRAHLYLDDVYEEGDPSRCLTWLPDQPLPLVGGVLSAVPAVGRGVALRQLAGGALQVRFRQGGESLCPAGRREHHTLKHLFQEAGVPPWERARVPLVYHDATLLAVAGYWICDGFQASPDEPGLRFMWSRAIVPPGSIW